MVLSPGTRLRSAVCATEVMVISAPGGDVALTCGGEPMIDHGASPPSDVELADDARGGTQMGKRYVNVEATLEVLCTKPGDGSLAVSGEALSMKQAKPLPASD